jgi:hypothetical protein
MGVMRSKLVVTFFLFLPACASDDPSGVVIEVRYGDAYDGMDGQPGGPVASADVRIYAPPIPPATMIEELATGIADASGKLTIEAIDAGDASISASEPGDVGPAGCEWTANIDVTLRDAGETIVVALDGMVCS